MRNATIQYINPDTNERSIYYTIATDREDAKRQLKEALNITNVQIVSITTSTYEIREGNIG